MQEKKEIKLPKAPIEKSYSPPYKTIVVLNYLSSLYEYPKFFGDFIWYIPSQYTDIKDFEISALTACFIYDGTYQSIKAAKDVETWFKNTPYNYIKTKEYNNLVIVENQSVHIYSSITLKDMYLFFKGLNELYSEYDGVIGKCRFLGIKEPFKAVQKALCGLRGFTGASVVAQARIHLFLFMATHCSEFYPFDQSKLLAPIFPRQFYVCKYLRLTKSKRLTTKTNIEVTEKLQWFSKKYPMTFWVGVVAYADIYSKKDNSTLKKLSTMENKRRHFFKR